MPRRDASIASVLAGCNAATRRLNAHLFAGAAVGGHAGQVGKSSPVLVGGSEDLGAQEGASRLGKRGRARRHRPPGGPFLRVRFVAFHRPGRELDGDNLRGGIKLLRDAVADWFGLDDSERCIEWEYSQSETRGREGVAVCIESLISSEVIS